MSRRSISMVALAAVALALPLAAGAALHNRLAKSVPAADETVAPPKEVRLWFTEKVEPKFSSITVMGTDSAKVETTKAIATDDPKSIKVDLTGAMAAGAYQVTWRTAGDDGHAVRGKYTFTVK